MTTWRTSKAFDAVIVWLVLWAWVVGLLGTWAWAEGWL